MTVVVSLPARIDLTNVAGVSRLLLAHRGSDLVVDAGEVTHLGGLGLQMLLAAQDSWARDGAQLSITPRSAAFGEALDSFGVPASTWPTVAGA